MTDYAHPWNIHLELTEGCNRRCSFCGIHSLYRERKDVAYRYMSVDLAEKISKSLQNWMHKCRIECSLQGEPMLNRKAPEIIRAIRHNFNKAQIMSYSNMDPLLTHEKKFNADKIFNLFQNGLNILVADFYGEKFDMSWSEFIDGLKQAMHDFGIPVFDLYKDKVKPWSYRSNTIAQIIAIDNTADRDILRTMNNQAGNTDPNLIQITGQKVGKLPKLTRCHQPFREMSIKHDGAIALCCMDWSREHIMGKFPEDGPLKQIWNNHHFNLVRNLLFNKRRDLLSPCDRCNYHGYKLGLINKPAEEVEDLEQASQDVEFIQLTNMQKYGNRYAMRPFSYEGLA